MWVTVVLRALGRRPARLVFVASNGYPRIEQPHRPLVTMGTRSATRGLGDADPPDRKDKRLQRPKSVAPDVLRVLSAVVPHDGTGWYGSGYDGAQTQTN
jgi:hypothetical protein